MFTWTVTLAHIIVYPWSNLTIENSIALKKWLFIPADTLLILDSNLLYGKTSYCCVCVNFCYVIFLSAADFLVYVVVCLQFIHFLRNPLKQGIPQQTDGTVPNFYESKYWIDYIKVSLKTFFHYNTVVINHVNMFVTIGCSNVFIPSSVVDNNGDIA